MKKRFIAKVTIILLLMITFIGCGVENSEKVISDNVSKESDLILKAMDEGNSYLQEDKFEEAKQSYEKAISIEKLNKETYLTIKDKYLNKGRVDDAYYIIKLAIKNNIDTVNMDTLLGEISEKFEIPCIETQLEQNSKYSLPDEVTMKINDVDIKVSVKWNNCSEIDTSKVGKFSYDGNSDEYGRKVKLELSVTAPVVNRQISGEEALEIVYKMVGTLPEGYHLVYDNKQKKDNKDYYVIHLYEEVKDDDKTSHTVTTNWYYVDANDKSVYKLDIVTGKLIK